MFRIILTDFKKLIRINRLPLVILLAVAVRAVMCFLPSVHEHPYSDEVYKNYTAQLEGKLTAEKTEYLNSRLAEIDELIGAYDEMQQRYTSGELTLEEYSAFTERHGRAKAEESTVRYLCRKCEALKGCSGFDRQLFYDTDWSDLFEDNGYDIVMLLAVLCIAVPAFGLEYSSGSRGLLLTSKRGKAQLALSKLTAVWVTVFVLSCLMSAARLGVFVYQNGLKYSDIPVGNILLTDGFGSTSLTEYYLKDSLIKALVWAMYSALMCLGAVLCGNLTFALTAGFIAGITPRIIQAGVQAGGGIIISGLRLVEMYPAYSDLPLMAGAALIKTAIVCIAAAAFWSRRE